MEEIKQYLINDKKLDTFSVMTLLDVYKNHNDIIQEFQTYIKTGTLPENGITSGDWTAKKLSQKLPHLEIYTIYEFLAGLRDHPERYKKYIAEGAPML